MSGIPKAFLEEDEYVDFTDISISREVAQAIIGCNTEEEKVKAVFEFVRDSITNAFDVDAISIPCTASETVRARVGTDDSKANLLAAMVRALGIPAGFCYQRLTILDDDSEGHYLHCYNAIYLDGKWIKLDASTDRGGKKGGFCKITLDLPFQPRDVYDECNIPGIFAKPNETSMQVHRAAEYIEEVMFNLPDKLDMKPDIKE